MHHPIKMMIGFRIFIKFFSPHWAKVWPQAVQCLINSLRLDGGRRWNLQRIWPLLLWNIKSSFRSYCAEFAHSWPHLLLGYPVERHGRLTPPRQRGFPSRETLSRQWEMLLLLLLSYIWSVTYKHPGLKRIYTEIYCFFLCYLWMKICHSQAWKKNIFVFFWHQMFS